LNWRRPRSPRYETVQWADSMGMMSWMSCIGSERNRSIGGQQPPPRATSPMMMVQIRQRIEANIDRSQFQSTIGLRDRHVLPSSSSSFSLLLYFPFVVDQIFLFVLLIRLIDFILFSNFLYLLPKLTILFY